MKKFLSSIDLVFLALAACTKNPASTKSQTTVAPWPAQDIYRAYSYFVDVKHPLQHLGQDKNLFFIPSKIVSVSSPCFVSPKEPGMVCRFILSGSFFNNKTNFTFDRGDTVVEEARFYNHKMYDLRGISVQLSTGPCNIVSKCTLSE